MRYLPLHPGSAEAIVMLEAARVQGKLEPVMAAVLEAQPDWHDGKMDAAWAAAEKAGLDVAKARAMPSAEAMAWMEQDIADEIGRASCRARVCQYVLISVVAVSLKKKRKYEENQTVRYAIYPW